jgi:hypothetical protein
MVKYWTTPNDANYHNSHAQVEGSDIEFFAFPFRPYHGAKGQISALVGGMVTGKWSATIYRAEVIDGIITGRTIPIVWKHFENNDAAFEWAAAQIEKYQTK